MRKIVQIIPADGWCSVYKDKDGKKWTWDLVGFALVEDEDGDRYVSGFDLDDPGCTSLVCDDTELVGYRRGHLPGEVEAE